MLFNVFLHGAAHVRRHGHHSREYRFRINVGALGHSDRASFSKTTFPQAPPLRIGKNLANSFIRSGRAQRKRRKKDQLAPHQGWLIIDEAAGETDLLKLVDSAPKQRPSGRQHIQPGKGRAMDDVSRTDPLGLNRDRRRDHTICPVLRPQHGNVINAIEQRNDGPHRIRILESGQRRLELRGLHRDP